MSESPDAQQTRPGLHRYPPELGPECAFVRDSAASYVMAALEPDEQRRHKADQRAELRGHPQDELVHLDQHVQQLIEALDHRRQDRPDIAVVTSY